MEEIEEFHNYAFGVQRANPDVIFGHWLQFDGKRIAEAVNEYRRCLDAKGGFVGLAMSGQSSGVAASDPAWDPLYRLAIEAGMPVMIFVGLTGIGQGLPGGKGILLDDGHPRHVDARCSAISRLADSGCATGLAVAGRHARRVASQG